MFRRRIAVVVGGLTVTAGVAIAVSPAGATPARRCAHHSAYNFPCSKPKPHTGGPHHITHHSADLTGFVNTGGAATTYFFEYGTHTPLDPTTRSRHTTKSGSVSIDVKHLKAHTRYYYRLIAKNRKGEVHGETRSFRTK